MEDKRVQDTGKSNRNSKIQLSKKVQTTPISTWLRVWANDQTRSSHSSEQSHFRAAKEVSPVARTLLPFQWRMMKHIAMASWLNRLKIHALLSSCSVLICYTIVTHLLSNINSHLLVVTTTLCPAYPECKIWEQLSPTTHFCNAWENLVSGYFVEF